VVFVRPVSAESVEGRRLTRREHFGLLELGKHEQVQRVEFREGILGFCPAGFEFIPRGCDSTVSDRTEISIRSYPYRVADSASKNVAQLRLTTLRSRADAIASLAALVPRRLKPSQNPASKCPQDRGRSMGQLWCPQHRLAHRLNPTRLSAVRLPSAIGRHNIKLIHVLERGAY